MTLTQTRERVPAAGRRGIQCVDSDVHPYPKRGELVEYLPEPWRSRYFRARRVGETIYYDAPDYAHAYAMRADTFPADGEFAGSDPDMTFRQLIVEAGVDIAILEPLVGVTRLPEATHALARALNDWQDNHWLDNQNNWHGRWRGSISVAIDDPGGAAREIETWAGHPYMAQILINAEMRPSWGHPKYDPIWAAATKHDITVSCHLARGCYETLPMPPVGFPSYNHDFMVTYSLLAANQVMSLVFDGVFDRFPTLRIVFVEHAFSWILPLMWRMDALYDARKSRVEIKRKPSEYVKDHIKFTTQPLDYPEDKTELTRALEWMECDKILLFSSDYPHWTFDDPRWLVKHLPKAAREAVMYKNGIATYKLPETVPVLENQVRVFGEGL
jgi:predicted TIM-barrel fold metal-dependent hydrolase